MNFNFKKFSIAVTLLYFGFFSTLIYALPFIIAPKAGTTLPTTISPGSTIQAFYTVTNNTLSNRPNNHVKYLPPNVTQVTTDSTYPDLCGSQFTLQQKGAIGSSCTLELSITGTVDAKDPDPHHHLFVCMPSDTTCAGTTYPLNVSSPPSGNSALSLSGVNCTGNHCITVGFHGVQTPGGGSVAPYAYKSDNDGSTWTPVVNFQLGDRAFGSLNAVACKDTTGDQCVAAGQHYDTDASLLGLPLIQLTTDRINWISSAPLPLPTNLSSGELADVTCQGSNCIAVGSYTPTSSSSVSLPVIYKSVDGGATWSLRSISNLPQNFNGTLIKVSCAANQCVAAGNQQNIVQVPLGVYSTDAGDTWTYSPITPPGTTVRDQGAGYGNFCIGSTCLIVGEDSTTQRALGLRTTNFGVTLSTATIPNDPNTVGTIATGGQCIGANCFLVGNAYTFDSNQARLYKPLTYKSTDTGSTFTLVGELPVPSGQLDAYVTGGSCDGNSNCAVVGYSEDSDRNQTAFVYSSVDNGTTWTNVVYNPPTNISVSQLSGVSCDTSANTPTCTAVGSGTDSNSNVIPIILASGDSGNSYNVISNLPQAANNQTRGQLSGISSCDNASCMAVGSWTDGSANTLPLIYTSFDSNTNWTLANSPTIPTGYNGNLTSVDCDPTAVVCTAVGYLTDQTDNTTVLPVIFNTADEGTTWTQSGALALPGTDTQGQLNAVSCSGQNCLASGYSLDTNSAQYPLVYSSADRGATWTLVSNMPATLIPNSTSISGLSCTGTTCSLGGGFTADHVHNFPLFYTSTNGGMTWQQQTNVTAQPGYTPLQFTSVYCGTSTNNNCTVVGQALNNSTNQGLSVTYTSADGGQSWLQLPGYFQAPNQDPTLITLPIINCDVTNPISCITIGSKELGQTDESGVGYISSTGGLNWTLAGNFPQPPLK